jgi:hypothetical protein
MTPEQGAGEMVAFKRRVKQRVGAMQKRLPRRGKRRVGRVYVEEKMELFLSIKTNP